MSLGTHADIRIDNTHGVLKVCRLVPTAKSSNYKIVIKEHMINCLKQCVVNREMISNKQSNFQTYIPHLNPHMGG